MHVLATGSIKFRPEQKVQVASWQVLSAEQPNPTEHVASHFFALTDTNSPAWQAAAQVVPIIGSNVKPVHPEQSETLHLLSAVQAKPLEQADTHVFPSTSTKLPVPQLATQDFPPMAMYSPVWQAEAQVPSVAIRIAAGVPPQLVQSVA